VFNGFYGSIFEADLDNFECAENTTTDDYTFDFKNYHNEVALRCCKSVIKFLNNTLISNIKFEFENIASPRYYNFTNDSINLTYFLDIYSIQAILTYLNTNKAEFEAYLKEKYTSRSGFVSFYDTDIDTWLNEYLNDEKKLIHCFGAVLEFICSNENFDTEKLYYDADIISICIDGNLIEK
jgi:hypothetical protein